MQQIQDVVRVAGLQIHSMKQHDPGGYYDWTGQFWQLCELRKDNK